MNFILLDLQTSILALACGLGATALVLLLQLLRHRPGFAIFRACLYAFFLASYLGVLLKLTLLPLPRPLLAPERANTALLHQALVLEPVQPILESWHLSQEALAAGNAYPLQLFYYNQIGNLLLLTPAALFCWIGLSFRKFRLRAFTERQSFWARFQGLGTRLSLTC